MKDLLKVVVYIALFTTPFVLLLVPSDLFFPYITGKNFAWRVLVEVAAAAWVLLALYDASYRPRLSGILAAAATLVGVMFLANFFGEYAPKSFWSNYERMEGWVTLAHFFVYFTVLGSFLRGEKVWSWFLNTALIAGVMMAFYGLGQIAGTFDVSQGSNWRIDARLGNSSYLGVYMLFHMFIAAWLFLRAKSGGLRFIYVALFVLFAFLLFNTGTRGTALGLFGGGILSFTYLAIMASKGASIKKWAAGGALSVVLIGAGLWAARDTAFVQGVPMLDRVVDISLSEGNIRFTVWQMAFEGFKERPILGWGQENFSYVFNKYYDPALYGAEPWYDRTHNIFMDWLVAGGVLGLLAYLSVLFSALWYTVLKPLYIRFKDGRVEESVFTVYEQALLLGLLAAYTFHNLFVFDNLASWIFYAIVLALIHSRVANVWEKVATWQINKEVLSKVVTPAVLVVLVLVVYNVNMPGYRAAQDIIDAYIASTPMETMASLQTAFSRDGFADQEITEQMGQLGVKLITSETITDEQKTAIKRQVETAFEKMIEKKSGDARLYVVYASFLQRIGDLDRAFQELEVAHTLSPRKQAIIEQQAITFLLSEQYDKALEYFKRAYDLDQTNSRGRVYYAVAALHAGDDELFEELIDFNELKMREGPGEIVSREQIWSSLINEQFALQSAYRLKNYDLLLYILSERVKLYPGVSEHRTNLAAAYYEMGDKEKAIEVLDQAMEDIPDFREEGESLIKGIRSE